MNIKKLIYSEEAYTTNLAEHIDDERLKKIGEEVYKGWEIDEKSCQDWSNRTEPAMNLAMQVYERKDFPFSNSSNVKFPLVATACIQFNARCYPNIIKGANIVKCKVVGHDVPVDVLRDNAGQPVLNPQTGQPIPIMKSTIADRVSAHMSYQLKEEMTEWEEDVDRGLLSCAVIGEEWKKTYFDPILGRNKSCRVPSENMTINYWAKSTESAQRITEKIPVYPNSLEEKKRAGYYLDIDYPTGMTDEKEQDTEDDDSPLIFLEQHRWLDLDDDGYKEPYIVTIHKSSKKVARIFVRFEPDGIIRDEKEKVIKISPEHYYTHTVFIPSPDGGSRGMGFGNLLGPINEAINTNINQLIDSGTLYNSNAGFIGKGASLTRGKHGGKTTFEIGEWKEVPMYGDDLRKSLVPLPVKEPSQVLFALLGLLINAGKELSSVSEVMSGQSPGANASPTTVMALVEQGAQVFSSIYKRIHRGLKSEFKKLYRLNALYLEEEQYFRVLDNEMAITRNDYNLGNFDVVPVSDPSEVSEIQKAQRAQVLMGLLGTGFNDQEIRRRIAESLNIPESEKLVLPDEALNQPNPEMELRKAEFQLKTEQFRWKQVTDRIKMLKDKAMAFQAYEKGEAARDGVQVSKYKAELESDANKLKFLEKQMEMMHNERLQRMDNTPSNQRS